MDRVGVQRFQTGRVGAVPFAKVTGSPSAVSFVRCRTPDQAYSPSVQDAARARPSSRAAPSPESPVQAVAPTATTNAAAPTAQLRRTESYITRSPPLPVRRPPPRFVRGAAAEVREE
ncbi:hypothetical protein ACSCB1_16390 [Streptomyces europaeiscabiei]|uniref:Uncharacterized protein n=2 Tax=Streptomyces TaxID=1883 RepID=A0ABU4NFN3_9ACTN|nr:MULTISPECIES: hypothetical protein [Streptomyces]MDX2749807.1 hypothetical protein [Streptomyces scabiei]MDX2761444.1 hypothetical protein [Streptomyces europaeiscabiei]MDX2768547.1 hypothetical protein [Streptomyces europaeiscabiei]MDX2807656.1 hypothetical protein [Streptomyces scabiei]MDX3196860.1 hypothetical protein [Streptomyces scabiei]